MFFPSTGLTVLFSIVVKLTGIHTVGREAVQHTFPLTLLSLAAVLPCFFFVAPPPPTHTHTHTRRPRLLFQVSDEEFFQTIACNPHFPHDTLRTHNDNLRFVNWWGDQASPAVVPPFRAVAAANSGSLFGRKFSSSTFEGRDGIRWLESYLADSSRVS